MSIFSRVKDAFKAFNGQFTTLDSDGFPVFGSTSNAGVYVSADTALYSTAVFSCVNLLASVIASIPVVLYERDSSGDTKERVSDPLHKLLKHKPNQYQTAFDYWLYNIECLLLRGGFVSWKNTLSNGRVASLIPVHPDTITREISDTGRIMFSGLAQWAGNRYLKFDKRDQSEFFWANYRTLDGLNPCSPIKYAAESIGLALSAEEHGARVFKNDATPPLLVTVPEKLSDEHLLNLAKMWKAGGSGKNYGMPRFLDGGAKLEKLSMSNEDAQYLQTRRFQKEDICGIFRVPPSMIGDTQRAQGWSTLEQKNSDFLTYTLMPYLENIEQAIERSLIPEASWDSVYADFDTDELMKADIQARTTYYTAMYNVGAISPNEIRGSEGYNKRDGGDEYKSANAPSVESPEAMKPETSEKGEEEDEINEK